MIRYLFLLSSILSIPLLLGVFSFVEAGSYQVEFKERDKDKFCKVLTDHLNVTAEYEGIVPCGKCVNLNPPELWPKYRECQASYLTDQDKDRCGIEPNAEAPVKYLDCQLCHIFVMADDVLDTIMWQIVPVLGFMFFLIAGFFYMVSGDDPSKRKKANDTIRNAVIGIALIYGSWIIVNTIFSFTPLVNTALLQGINPGGWFSINCPISY